MSAPFEVAVLVGSLRKASLSRKIALALIDRAPESLLCKVVEIGDLPLYNEDLEGQTESWQRFRGEIASVNAVLFVTPEYNRSIPGCLKNAIDVGSRPGGKSVWDGKAAGVVSDTPYRLGGMGANLAVRQALIFLNMPTMQMPEAYLSGSGEMFGEDDAVKSEETKKFMVTFMSAFERWVTMIARGSGSGESK